MISAFPMAGTLTAICTAPAPAERFPEELSGAEAGTSPNVSRMAWLLKTKFTNVVVPEAYVCGLCDGIPECVDVESAASERLGRLLDEGGDLFHELRRIVLILDRVVNNFPDDQRGLRHNSDTSSRGANPRTRLALSLRNTACGTSAKMKKTSHFEGRRARSI